MSDPVGITPAHVEPLAITEGRIGEVLAGMSARTWRRMSAAKLNPEPVRLGTRKFWLLSTLQSWLAAGCPDRATFAKLQRRAIK